MGFRGALAYRARTKFDAMAQRRRGAKGGGNWDDKSPIPFLFPVIPAKAGIQKAGGANKWDYVANSLNA